MNLCALISFLLEIRAKKVDLIVEETLKENVENSKDELNFDIGGEAKNQYRAAVTRNLDYNFLEELEASLDKTKDNSSL